MAYYATSHKREIWWDVTRESKTVFCKPYPSVMMRLQLLLTDCGSIVAGQRRDCYKEHHATVWCKGTYQTYMQQIVYVSITCVCWKENHHVIMQQSGKLTCSRYCTCLSHACVGKNIIMTSCSSLVQRYVPNLHAACSVRVCHMYVLERASWSSLVHRYIPNLYEYFRVESLFFRHRSSFQCVCMCVERERE